jgi:hypothetical protein
MIRVLSILVFSALSLLSASAKENEPIPAFPAAFISLFNPQTPFSSDWETVPSWQLTSGTGSLLYTYTRSLDQVSPTILKEGVVVVFAKGYDFEGVSKAEEKPLGLPFYMAPANEAALNPIAWSYAPEENKVTIGLSMNENLKAGFEQARQDIQLRFFVLTPDFLHQHKLTPLTARKISYSQLITLLNATP